MPAPRFALIALDACQSDILLRLADAGRAPTIAQLRQSSLWAPTRNPEGLFVGAVWPSITTGTSPASHGRYCFRQLKAGTYEVHPTDVHHTIQRPSLWQVASDAGQRCAVIDLPHTALAEDINGIQLVDWGAHDANPGFRAHDEAFRAEIEVFGPHPMGVDCNGRRRTVGDFSDLRDKLLASVDKRVELITRVLDKEAWDLFIAGFSESHCVGHQAWCVHDPYHPRHDPDVRAALGDPLDQIYERLDRALGEVLDLLGPTATTFVLLSHGMGPHYGGNHLLDELLLRLDISQASAPQRATLAAKKWARSHAPASLRRLNRRRRGGKVLSQGTRTPTGNAVAQIPDAAQRHFFGVPNNDVYGAVRLNVRGREPAGCIDPADVPAQIAALTEALLELQNIDTGAQAVQSVMRTADLYQGEHAAQLPDLLIEWNWDAPIERIGSPRIGTIERHDDEERTGDHRPPGLLFVHGPDVEPTMLPRAIPSQDIAPTIAALLGVDMPTADGVPIPEVVRSLAGRT